jgi:hypothetical protein
MDKNLKEMLEKQERDYFTICLNIQQIIYKDWLVNGCKTRIQLQAETEIFLFKTV